MSWTVPSGIVQEALWFQLLLWMYLYNSRIHFKEYMRTLFYLGGTTTFIYLFLTGLSIRVFSNIVLMQYTVFLMLAVYLYDQRFEFKQAVCLGFLTVFLNSFYWEFFYHVYEFQIWYPYSLGFDWWFNRIPQWLRIVPAFWFRHHFNITNYRYIKIGLIFSFILTWLRFAYHIQYYIQPLNRLTCLLLLVFTIIESKPIIYGVDG